jgi:amidase
VVPESRLLIDRNFTAEGVHEEVVTALTETEAAFIGLGADVREIAVPYSERVFDAFLTVCSTEAAAVHKETYPMHASQYGDELSEFIEGGRKTTALELAESLQERNRFADRLSTVFKEIDLLLTPTLPFPVPRLDTIDFEHMTIAYDDAGSSPRSIYPVSLRFTALFNVGGNPAINFPAGFSSSGLPVGMQLAGPHLADELLLRTVHVFQKSTEWHGCHPLG